MGVAKVSRTYRPTRLGSVLGHFWDGFVRSTTLPTFGGVSMNAPAGISNGLSISGISSYQLGVDEIPFADLDFYGVLCWRENDVVVCNLPVPHATDSNEALWGECAGKRGLAFARAILDYYVRGTDEKRFGRTKADIVELLCQEFCEVAVYTMLDDGGKIEAGFIRDWISTSLADQ